MSVKPAQVDKGYAAVVMAPRSVLSMANKKIIETHSVCVFSVDSMRQPSKKFKLKDISVIPAFEPVIDSARLKKLCQYLEKRGRQPEFKIGLDTEFKGKDLLLIQLRFDEKTFLIDPKSIGDLSCFFEILKNPNIIKIFHACRGDIPHLGLEIINCVDTQVLAAYAGLGSQLSYKNLVEKLFPDVRLDKSETLSDWSQEFLSPAQMKYAIEDVEYLSACHGKLMDLLAEKSLCDLALDDCRRICEELQSREDAPAKDKNLMQPVTHDLFERFKKEKNKIAEELNLDKSLICSDTLLKNLVCFWRSGSADLTSLNPRLKGWRASAVVPKLKAVFIQWEMEQSVSHL